MNVLIFLLGYPVVLLSRGITVSVLWSWFVVPTGTDPISVPVGIGFSLLVSVLTGGNVSDDDQDGVRNAIKSVIFGVIYPLFLLLTGWVVTLFMI